MIFQLIKWSSGHTHVDKDDSNKINVQDCDGYEDESIDEKKDNSD
jgi:hypothetical protein